MFDPPQMVKSMVETSTRLVLNTTLKNIEVMMTHHDDIEIMAAEIKAYEMYFKTIDALNKDKATK